MRKNKKTFEKGFTPLKNVKNCVKKALGNGRHSFGSVSKSKFSLMGFTLIELLFVIAIIGIVAAVVVINISVSSKEKANISKGLSYADSVRAALSSNEVAWWKFDEGSGNTAKDTWKGLTVSLGSGGNWVSGVGGKGNAYQFESGGWVATTFPSAIGYGATYSFWFSIPAGNTDLEGGFFCVDEISSSDPRDNLINSANNGGLGDRDGLQTNVEPSFLITSADGKWHHMMVSKKQLGVGSYNYRICLDTQCVNKSNTGWSLPNITEIQFNGGCGAGAGNFGDQGIIIDELQIYSDGITS